MREDRWLNDGIYIKIPCSVLDRCSSCCCVVSMPSVLRIYEYKVLTMYNGQPQYVIATVRVFEMGVVERTSV